MKGKARQVALSRGSCISTAPSVVREQQDVSDSVLTTVNKLLVKFKCKKILMCSSQAQRHIRPVVCSGSIEASLRQSVDLFFLVLIQCKCTQKKRMLASARLSWSSLRSVPDLFLQSPAVGSVCVALIPQSLLLCC